MLENSSFGFLKRFFNSSDSIVLTSEIVNNIENSLLGVDITPKTVTKILQPLTDFIGTKVANDFIISSISNEMVKILRPCSKPIEIDISNKPQVVLLCGMNGSGKTSTIGKMAYGLNKYKWNVVVAACDTFRAAASNQLLLILQKNGLDKVKFITFDNPKEDPRTISYRAYDIAKQTDSDILLIDTAGRSYNKPNLMEELSGIIRTLNKKHSFAPHNIILVIDGNTGKNAIQQVTEFSKICKISGLIITKLDGQARCGIVLSIADQFGITIHGITTGENIDDLHDFIPENFIKMLLKIRN